jgi:REP element-mobilizing transposase RayT
MSYTCLYYHIVFSTKDRRPLLDGPRLDRVIRYVSGICGNLNGKLFHGGGAPDHVHLAANVPPTKLVAGFIRDVKSNSSRWVHESFPGLQTFAWQDKYAAFTVSPSMLDKVRRYIADQERHHRKVTFQEELIALLKRHGVQYDERYLWT